MSRAEHLSLMTSSELHDRLTVESLELFKLRYDVVAERRASHLIKKTKREIARIKTVQRERSLVAAESISRYLHCFAPDKLELVHQVPLPVRRLWTQLAAKLLRQREFRTLAYRRWNSGCGTIGRKEIVDFIGEVPEFSMDAIGASMPATMTAPLDALPCVTQILLLDEEFQNTSEVRIDQPCWFQFAFPLSRLRQRTLTATVYCPDFQIVPSIQRPILKSSVGYFRCFAKADLGPISLPSKGLASSSTLVEFELFDDRDLVFAERITLPINVFAVK